MSIGKKYYYDIIIIINNKGVDGEYAKNKALRELAVGASHGEAFAIVASEPGGRKHVFAVEPPRDYCVNV